MKVMLVLEAMDKASRTIRAMQRNVETANAASQRGAADAARAHDRASRSIGLMGRAHAAAGRAAASFAETSRRVARTAEDAWKRVLVAVEHYAARQADIARRGVGNVGAGAKQVGQGVLAGGKVAAGVATGAGALGAAGALISNWLVKPAAEFEDYGAVLEVVEGSAEKARKALTWVSDFAAKTPYDLSGVTQAFVAMKGYGLDPMSGSLRTLGDAASGMNKPLMQGVEALADARMGNNGRLKEAFQIDANKKGKYFEYTYTDNKGKQATKRALASDQAAIQKTLLGILDSRFAGAMEKRSKTWNGMMANLGDGLTRINLAIMNAGLFDWMKGKLTEVLAMLDGMAADGSLQEWAKRISTGLQQAMTIGWEAAKGMGQALLTLAGAAERIATAIGGWENFAYLGLAVAFAQPLMMVASGLFLISRGALAASLAVARLAILGTLSVGLIAVQSAAQLAGLALRGSAAAIMLLGRGIIGLPGAMMRAAVATRALALAAMGLPGRMLALARAVGALALAGLRALPGMLMGTARAIGMMAVSGLASLPGLLMGAARGFMMFGASLMATPIGWFLAGVAAIAAAAYLIYANWDSIGPWLSEKWEAIKKVFSDAWTALTAFDWSGLVPDFNWRSLLPSWDWSSIIPSISLPSFDWGSLLPSWDWSAIIPAMPDFKSWFGGGAAPPPPAAVVPSINLAQLTAQAAEAQKAIAAIRPAAQAAVQAASQVLSSASFHSHGVALMTTLAAGIREGSGAAVKAVKGVAQQLRDHLPHSPAKTGPLSDLDKIKFSETLALGIRPGPAVAAVGAVAAGMMAAMAGPGSALALPVSVGVAAEPSAPVSTGVPAQSSGGGSVGDVHISVSAPLTLTINGSASVDEKQEFARLLRAHADEIAKVVKENIRRDERKAY